MAKAEAKGGAAKEGVGSKKILILVVVLVLLAGGGGAAYWFLVKQGGHAEEGAPTKKKKAEAPPVFMTLETFVVNLMPHDAEQYLQVGVDLKVAEQHVIDQVKLHMPEIRSATLVLLSSKRGDELATPEGKQKLAEDIRNQVNAILGTEGEESGVTGVFFTSFVIQ